MHSCAISRKDQEASIDLDIMFYRLQWVFLQNSTCIPLRNKAQIRDFFKKSISKNIDVLYCFVPCVGNYPCEKLM